MRQLRYGVRFALEPLAEAGVLGQFARKNLDRHRAIERSLIAAVDRRHPAAPELALEHVAIAESTREAYRDVGHAAARRKRENDGNLVLAQADG